MPLILITTSDMKIFTIFFRPKLRERRLSMVRRCFSDFSSRQTDGSSFDVFQINFMANTFNPIFFYFEFFESWNFISFASTSAPLLFSIIHFQSKCVIHWFFQFSFHASFHRRTKKEKLKPSTIFTNNSMDFLLTPPSTPQRRTTLKWVSSAKWKFMYSYNNFNSLTFSSI